MRDPADRLRDILEATAAIERYTQGGRAAFDADELVRCWVVHHLQIVCEAVYKLPPAIKQRAPETPWTQIVGMRHILVHSYFMIDPDPVWQAAATDVPALRPTIERLLAEIEP